MTVVSITKFFLISLLFSHGKSTNILGLMGCASPSHHLWNEIIVNALAARGHNLTILSVDKNDSPMANVSYIHLEEAYNVKRGYYKNAGANFGSSPGLLHNVRLMYDFKTVTCEGIFLSNGFKEGLNLSVNFDLILFDIEGGQCLLKLVQKHPHVPVVAISAFKMDQKILEIIGGHTYPAYVPHILNSQDIPMDFWQRLYNFGTYLFGYFYRIYSETLIDTMTEKYEPSLNIPLNTLYNRIKIAIVNTHPAIDNSQSLPPNVIEVGGLHIKEAQPLPDDIESFISSADRGVVLISFGSNIKVEALGEQRLEAILNVTRQFSHYNFLWKVEKDKLIKNVPKNLLLRKWLPQIDILASSKTKAFLTHAGSLGLQEAIWHGVPVITMPFFFDQFNNAHRAEAKGYGRQLNFEQLNEEQLLNALTKVLKDEVYTKKMLEMKKSFRDRQNKPLDTAIWWIEYILRNPQADYLSPHSRQMSYIATNSLDVILILLVICLISMLSGVILIKNVFGICFKNNNQRTMRKINLRKEKKKIR